MCMCKPVSRKPKLSFSLVICFNCWGFKRLQSFSFYLCLVPLFKHILTAILYLNIFFPFYIKLICLVLFCRIWIRDTDMWKTSEQKTTAAFVICFTCWGNKDFSNFLFMLRVLFNCLNTFFLQCYIWILYFIFTCNLICIFFFTGLNEGVRATDVFESARNSHQHCIMNVQPDPCWWMLELTWFISIDWTSVL